jgi:hypothetical protein
MSALPPKADIRQRDWDVRFVPLTDIANCISICAYLIRKACLTQAGKETFAIRRAAEGPDQPRIRQR